MMLAFAWRAWPWPPVQVKVQQARQELNEQNHAYDPERIGDAVANADAAAGSPGQAFRGGRSAGVLVQAPAKMPEEIPAGTLNQMPHRQVNRAETPTITADITASLLPCLAMAEKEAVACAQPHAVHEERQAKLPPLHWEWPAGRPAAKRHEKHFGKAEGLRPYIFNAAQGDAEEDDSEKDQGCCG